VKLPARGFLALVLAAAAILALAHVLGRLPGTALDLSRAPTNEVSKALRNWGCEPGKLVRLEPLCKTGFKNHPRVTDQPINGSRINRT
jgi:hypothetical protein